MTISGADSTLPTHNGEGRSSRDEQPPGGGEPKGDADKRSDERSPDHQALINLAGRLLGTWGHTARLLVVVTVVVGLAILGLWLLQAHLDLGPLRIGRG